MNKQKCGIVSNDPIIADDIYNSLSSASIWSVFSIYERKQLIFVISVC